MKTDRAPDRPGGVVIPPSEAALAVFQCSLILECQFPDTSKKFPVLARREFDRKTLTYISETKLPPQFGGQIRENSLYFPGYQGIWLPRQVRCSLPAQPPSRGFSASLHTFARRSRRSPELRH